MIDLTPIATAILKKQKRKVNRVTLEEMKVELESCMKGRKVQILILLENEIRMKSYELFAAMHLKSPNLASYTGRLKGNFLIEIYDETKFKRPEEINYKFHYHSITDLGRALIKNLGK